MSETAATLGFHVDAHVHIHGVFDLDVALQAATDVALSSRCPLVLTLTDRAGDGAFDGLRGNPALEPTAEPGSLRLRDAPVFLIAGRQLISTERIEVLALALDPSSSLHDVPDEAEPAASLVERVLHAGAVAVLPWSVGKWMGARGRRVAEIAGHAGRAGHVRFFLGDIPARAWPWPSPRPFRDRRVLCGTDPLPLPGAERGIGRYRTRVRAGLDPDRPAASLVAALEAGCEIRSAGRRDGLPRMIADQVRLRIRRRAERDA